MKKSRLISCLLALVVCLACAFAGCGGNGPASSDDSGSTSGGGSVPTPDTVEIAISNPGRDTLSWGDEVQLEVVVVTSPASLSKKYTWQYSVQDVVSVDENDVLRVVKNVVSDVVVTVTAVSEADNLKQAHVTFTVKPLLSDGNFHELNADVIEEVSNPNITFSGRVVDVYKNYSDSHLNASTAYDMTVKMNEGKWYGTWNAVSDEYKANVITDYYVKGDEYNGLGHTLNRIYVDRHNTVSEKVETDYMSDPLIWEDRHMWNHLGSLAVDISPNKYSYDADTGRYRYLIDEEDYEEGGDLYFMTYLAYSLTPMLSDTLMSFSFTITDGHIDKIYAQTEVLQYGDPENPTAESYTTVELTVSDIGSTVITDPEVFEAPANAQYLETALNNMKTARNYTYQATQNETYTAMPDEGEYEYEAATGASSGAVTVKYNNSTSPSGTAGERGYVTENAIIIASTGMYTVSDGNPYHTEYSGYKQLTDNTYDAFTNVAKDGVYHFEGTRQYFGNIFDKMPEFDFSANIFKFAGSNTDGTGKTTYRFVLRDTSITKEIAMQMSAHSYADNASVTTTTTLSISVDDSGHIVSTTFPYNVYDAYVGTINTSYSAYGTTVIDDDAFDDYVPRVLRVEWSQYVTQDYDPNHNYDQDDKADTMEVFKYLYGEEVANLPTPALLIEVFGDNLFGPWFDYEERTRPDGSTYYRDHMDINTSTDQYDENGKITNYGEIKEALIEKFTAIGYTYSEANSGQAHGDYYLCFVNGNITIVFENNRTKNFFISFYRTGEWVLS